MNNSFDGKTYKRGGGHTGDRLPAVGVGRTRAVYVATGGETSINLSTLSPAITYYPGKAQLDVKRSSGGSMIVNIDYFETSASTIGFPATEPLIAGEVIEITRSVEFTGVMAANIKPHAHSEVASAGQTLVTANFTWEYDIMDGVTVGGVVVYKNGILQARGSDYTEVDLAASTTNKILFSAPLAAGDKITVLPTFYVVDDSVASTSYILDSENPVSGGGTTIIGSSSDGVIEQRIAVPNTAITNRAKARDPQNNLEPQFGTKKFYVRSLERCDSEIGPSETLVYKPVGDDSDRCRFWSNYPFSGSLLNDSYSAEQSYIAANYQLYMEVVFYGTGLNLLTEQGNVAIMELSVDGVSQATFTDTYGVTTSAQGNAYNTINITKNLSPGVHTVRIGISQPVTFTGYEIIGTSALQVSAGDYLVSGTAVESVGNSSMDYNLGFENVLDANVGTKGGHVVIYGEPNGDIKKVITVTNTSQVIGISASHTNEQVVAIHSPTEFSYSSSTDIGSIDSMAAANNEKFGLLDDGITALYAKSITLASFNTFGANAFAFNYSGTPELKLTFVGTGIDLLGSFAGCTFDVDGTTFVASSAANTLRVASGLPMGTHTLRITGGTRCHVAAFKVFAPKKPTVPATGMEIGSYFLAASDQYIKTHPLKYSSCTTGFSNSPNFTQAANYSYGVVADGPASQTVRRYFWGTGVNVIGHGGSPWTVKIDDVFAPASTTATGGYNSTNGQAVMTTVGSAVVVSGLALGWHKLEITASASHFIGSIGVQSPIFSYSTIYGNKSLGLAPTWHTTGVVDTLVFDGEAVESIAHNLVSMQSSTTVTSSSNTYQLVPRLHVNHWSKTGKVKISYSLGTSASAHIALWMNQALVWTTFMHLGGTGNYIVMDVPTGHNHFGLHFRWNGANAEINNGPSIGTLIVEDVHE